MVLELGQDPEVDKAVDRMLDDFVDLIFAESQENFIRFKKWDTGFAARSGNVERRFLEKKIVYSAPYVAAIEFGREPGSMPPVDPIYEWARRRLGMSESEAKKVAWAIAKKIEKEGIEPTPILRNAITTARKVYKV